MSNVVRFAHARQLKRRGGRPLCEPGIRAWCARHDIDWNEFTGPGVPIEVFERIGDHYALQVIEVAREDGNDGR